MEMGFWNEKTIEIDLARTASFHDSHVSAQVEEGIE